MDVDLAEGHLGLVEYLLDKFGIRDNDPKATAAAAEMASNFERLAAIEAKLGIEHDGPPPAAAVAHLALLKRVVEAEKADGNGVGSGAPAERLSRLEKGLRSRRSADEAAAAAEAAKDAAAAAPPAVEPATIDLEARDAGGKTVRACGI